MRIISYICQQKKYKSEVIGNKTMRNTAIAILLAIVAMSVSSCYERVYTVPRHNMTYSRDPGFDASNVGLAGGFLSFTSRKSRHGYPLQFSVKSMRNDAASEFLDASKIAVMQDGEPLETKATQSYMKVQRGKKWVTDSTRVYKDVRFHADMAPGDSLTIIRRDWPLPGDSVVIGVNFKGVFKQ